jgi:hypothetical protein
MSSPHPLLALFTAAADGRFPPADGTVAVLPPLPGGLECSVGFTGHAVVATALSDAEVRALEPDAFGGSMSAAFLQALAGPGGTTGCLDAVLVAPGTGGPPRLPELTGPEATDHPRVRYATGLRTGVRVHGDERGLITLADGLAGRRELSIELYEPGHGGKGLGRGLIEDALTLVPRGEPLFAAVSPGNARSLRAFLGCGFTPLGSEVIVHPGPRR